MEHRFDIRVKFEFSRMSTGGIVLINTPSAILGPVHKTNFTMCKEQWHQNRHPGARMYLELTRRR